MRHSVKAPAPSQRLPGEKEAGVGPDSKHTQKWTMTRADNKSN